MTEQVHFSASKIASFVCPTRGYWRYKRKVEPPQTTPMAFSSHVHMGLTLFLQNKPVESLIDSWQYSEKEKLYTREKMVEIFDEISARGTFEGVEPLLLEQELRIEILPGVTYIGKPDLVEIREDVLQVTDLKVTGKPGFYSIYPNNQLMGYAWLVSKLLEAPVSRINALLIEVNAKSKNGVIIDKSGVERPILTMISKDVAASDILAWEERTKAEIETILLLDSIDIYPQRDSCCSQYGGCPYKSICQAPENFDQYIRMGLYTLKE